jgi:hypothetical protein
MNYANFVSKPRSFVVAPAGYGKTHAIATCLKHTNGRQLVLTHTHAGVASIKEKLQNENIPNNSFRVETITSFAQKYVNAFYCGTDVPEQENGREYYPFIINKAKWLFSIQPIRDVIKSTYSGLFVDEYQDCNILQHELIKELGSILPTRLLGDHLQGIFDFNGDHLVDFDKDLNDFEQSPELNTPWRWIKKNQSLGEALKCIRNALEKADDIDLSLYDKVIEVMVADENDKYNYKSEYNKKIWSLCNEDDVLIIHPDSANLNARKDFTSRFNNAFIIVEAIDSKDFYELSHKLDSITLDNVYQTLYELVPILFNGTASRDRWFNSSGVKIKRSDQDKVLISPINIDIIQLKQKISFSVISRVLKNIEKLPNMRCYRKELLWDLCGALEDAEYKTTTVYQSMEAKRNQRRREGRKLHGRCVGTTLLTKGLEFDTVAVLDAHKIKCPKNFYVAITRASRRLIMFTTETTISPYPKNNGDK